MNKKTLLNFWLLLLCMIVGGVSSVWATDVTYTVTSTSTVSTSGTAPVGSSVTYSQTYKTAKQATAGNSLTLTLSNWSGYTISNITLSMKSNQSSGSGNLAYSIDGGETFTYLVGTTSSSAIAFNNPAWNGVYTNSYTNISKDVEIIAGSSNIVIKICVSTNSLYCQSYKITYSPNKTPAGLAYDTSSYNVLPNASFTAPTLTNPYGLSVSYSSSNTSVATVDASTGAVSIGATEGTATITASSAETDTYAAGSASYAITVAKGTTTVTLSDDSWTANILDGATKTLTASVKYSETALETPSITWESSNTAVATVSGGVVTPVAPGSATIRANYTGTTVYAASYADCAVTVNQANTTLTLDNTSVEQDLATARTFTLTPTVKAMKSDDTEVDVESPTVTWTSSDETVATVSDGVVTGLKEGTVTITASYAGGGNYKAADDATCSVNFSDTRTGVSISSFTAAKTTLVEGDEQVTAVTNDQTGWTASYTYSSSDEEVATVDENGVIIAVGKGTATITATINIALDETGYKAGATASKALSITVTKPFHTVTFWVNGDNSLTASVEEGQAISFPTAVETTPGDGEFPKVINGQTFQGWYTGPYTDASVAPSYINTASTNMGTSNVPYYAVYADMKEVESDDVSKATLSQTLQYDTWSYSGSTTNKSNYRLFHSGSYIESDPFDLSKLIKVVVKGGTYGGGSYNSLTIGDGTNTWKAVTVSGSSETGINTYTGGTALSGTNKLRITCNSGTASNSGIRISKVEIYVKGTVTIKSNYTTDNRAASGVSFDDDEVDVKLTSDYTGQALTNPNSVSVTYSSSDETVATVNSSTGAIELLKAGTTTITATFSGNATYKPAEVSYTLNVTEKTPHGLAFATAEVGKLTTDEAFTNLLTNNNSLTVSYSSSATSVATVNSSTGEVTIKGAGSTIITATFAGDEDYEAGNASYTLTVSKATPTLSFVSDNVIGREGKAFAGNALTNPANLTISYSSSDEEVATIDSETGAVSIIEHGTTTITASFAGNETYTSGSASYTLKVLDTPTITVSDQSIAWGETFTYNAASNVTGGPVSVTSANEGIATVDGLVITPAACGSVTITVSTSEDDTYKAGSNTFTLTITAPAGKTTAPSSDVTTTFDFSQNGWGLPTSSTTLSGEYTKGTLTVTISGTGYYFGSKALLLGKNGATITLPAFDKPVTQIDVSGAEGASTKVTQNIYVGSTAVSTETTSATSKKEYAIDSDYQSAGNIYTFKVTNDYNTQVSKIVVHQYQAPTATVTLNKYGYATYCSVNPIDFTSTTGYTAWRVSGIDGDAITFTKIKEKIKGGQGVLLYNKDADGENTTTVTIKFADSSTAFTASENLLVGTTAPTYLTQTDGDYTNYAYSKGENAFMKVKDGSVIPANKAYLPVPNASEARFTFVFEDNTTTTVQGVTVRKDAPDTYYNLSGQRVENPKKGGIYIKNGKKVMMK
jgi:uncharacterized protein YjdB